jgi:RNA polymerase sigma-70 factor (ECF subfamily)
MDGGAPVFSLLGPLTRLMNVRRPHSTPEAGPRARRLAGEALAHVAPLYATAVRLTGSRTEAEDLVQDTLLKAHRFADRFQAGTNLKAWLFAILHNTFRNDRRGERRNPVRADSEVVERAADVRSGPPSPEERLLRASFSPALQEALAGLPPAYREAVWLRDVEDFTYAEIADMLDVPTGTVMSRISRGRRLLHARLTGEGAERDRAVPTAQRR